MYLICFQQIKFCFSQSPEEGNKNDSRDGTRTAEAIHSEEKKALGRLTAVSEYLKREAIQRRRTESLAGSVVIGQGERGTNEKRRRFRLHIRKKLLQ